MVDIPSVGAAQIDATLVNERSGSTTHAVDGWQVGPFFSYRHMLRYGGNEDDNDATAFGVSGGFVREHVVGFVDLSWAPETSNGGPVRRYRFGALRLGARLPLKNAALSIGSGLEYTLYARDDAPGTQNANFASFPVWATLDIKPTCDVGGFITGSASLPGSGQLAMSYFSIGVYFQPNRRCREGAVQTGFVARSVE